MNPGTPNFLSKYVSFADVGTSTVYENGGSVGIGTVTPGDELQVVGDLRVGTAGANGCLKNFAASGLVTLCTSDARLKRDIDPFGPALAALSRLQPVHYYWRAAEFPKRHFGDARAYGPIAQDVEQVLPNSWSPTTMGIRPWTTASPAADGPGDQGERWPADKDRRSSERAQVSDRRHRRFECQARHAGAPPAAGGGGRTRVAESHR